MKLLDFFQLHQKAALAFSGGVDSAYLLYAALQCGASVRAYYVKSDFQPQFELDDAQKLAAQLGADMTVIEADALSLPEVAANGADRCYHCKKLIMSAIAEAARADGFCEIMDGTNASDSAEDRPGMKALRELAVLSPLKSCGLTKERIRQLSREAGLFTWNKPAYACLATRISTGERITKDKLKRTEAAENFLFSLGFSDFRIRMAGNSARIQAPAAQLGKVIEHRESILKELKNYYDALLLDLEARE